MTSPVEGTQTPEVPEWIYPEAPVVLLVDDVGQRKNPIFYRATVGKIAKHSFTVTFGGDREERIRLRDLHSKDFGSSWQHWRYRALEPTSPEVKRLEAAAARVRSREKARAAMRALTERHDNDRMDDLDLIRTAIKTLAEHADLVLAQDGGEHHG